LRKIEYPKGEESGDEEAPIGVFVFGKKAVPLSKRGVILLGIVLFRIAAAGFGKELFAQAGGAHLVYGTKDTPDTLDLTESGLPIVYAIAWT
jgi:hypothetical protein